MLQWLPGSKSEVVWNDRRDGRFISVVCDIHSGKRRILEAPIYALSPDGKLAIYPDFRRLNDCRPGYGYAGLPDPNRDVPIPDDAGIWRLDIQSGQSKLVIHWVFPKNGMSITTGTSLFISSERRVVSGRTIVPPSGSGIVRDFSEMRRFFGSTSSMRQATTSPNCG